MLSDKITATDPEKSGNTQDNPPAGDKAFSQEDLDKIVGDRLARADARWAKKVQFEIQAALSQFRTEHGFDDDFLEKHANRDKTDAEDKKLKGNFAKLQAQLEKAEKNSATIQRRLEDELTSGAILRAAVGKSHDPESVLLHLRSRVSLDDNFNTVILDEDGEFAKDLTMDKIIDELLTRKKHLALPTSTTSGAGSRSAEPRGSDHRPDFKTEAGRQAYFSSKIG